MRIINDDCLKVLPILKAQCVFADPPDNIGLGYGTYKDTMPASRYHGWLHDVVAACIKAAPITWLSFNAKWLVDVGVFGRALQWEFKGLEIRPCVQTFTFGQHRHSDLGNNYRPLWRFRRDDAPIYPDAIRVESWRQANGDKRADPRGRVPGDVFDFPRVTGNSKQRRAWHPTQLHEGLVERCILLSTLPGQLVVDPFAGTGTTLRVCSRIGREAVGIEIDSEYCKRIEADSCRYALDAVPTTTTPAENAGSDAAKRSDICVTGK